MNHQTHGLRATFTVLPHCPDLHRAALEAMPTSDGQSVAHTSKPYIRRTRKEDVFALALTMRQQDRAELYHRTRGDPAQTLQAGVAMSKEPFTIERAGQPVAIFGVVGQPGAFGVPWMLGTDELSRCRSLLRECRERLDRYTKEYRYLTNAVWSKNTVHINWIKWLGFQFEGEDICNGETFLHFYKAHHHV